MFGLSAHFIFSISDHAVLERHCPNFPFFCDFFPTTIRNFEKQSMRKVPFTVLCKKGKEIGFYSEDLWLSGLEIYQVFFGPIL